jgi:hypothetical protein
LSSNRILRSLQSGVSLTVMPLALSFRTIASRSLCHFRHSSKRCATVCLLPLHHQYRASSTFPILIRWAPVMAWPDLSCRYREATNFLASLTCLLSLVAGFHLSPTACFTYDSLLPAVLLCLQSCRHHFWCCLAAMSGLPYRLLFRLA